ncbi:MAG: transposase [Clostridia bacterium]
MPRIARVKGEFSTYHIIQRGNARRNIFNSDDDRMRYLETLERMRGKYNFKLESFCLMDNHVHLLINDNGNDISKIVKSINISYAYYFNRRNKRVGHLFQDRFKSELIDNDSYLLAVSAYIHNNPVKARMVKMPGEYKWSSFRSFIDNESDETCIISTDRILGTISANNKKAMEEYYSYVLKYEPMIEVMDVEEDKILYAKDNVEYIDSIEAAKQLTIKVLDTNGINLGELNRNKALRRELILKLRKNSSLTLTQIGELCGGLSSSMICKILKG